MAAPGAPAGLVDPSGAVRDFWSATHLDLAISIILFLVGWTLTMKGARLRRLFCFMIGAMFAFMVLGQFPMWVAKVSAAMQLQDGMLTNILILVLPCLLFGLFLAFFFEVGIFCAGSVGGWFIARQIMGMVGAEFAGKEGEFKANNVLWYVFVVALCLGCGFVALLMSKWLQRYLYSAIATGLTVGSVGEILVCVAIYMIKGSVEGEIDATTGGLRRPTPGSGNATLHYSDLTTDEQRFQFIQTLIIPHNFDTMKSWTFQTIFHPRLLLPFSALRDIPANLAYFRQTEGATATALMKQYYAQSKFTNDWLGQLVLAGLAFVVFMIASCRWGAEETAMEKEEEEEQAKSSQRSGMSGLARRNSQAPLLPGRGGGRTQLF